MVDWVAGMGGFLAAAAQEKGCMVKGVFLGGVAMAAALEEGTFARWHFCLRQPSLQNLPVLMPTSWPVELKAHQFLRDQFEGRNCSCC